MTVAADDDAFLAADVFGVMATTGSVSTTDFLRFAGLFASEADTGGEGRLLMPT
jgi:hypothetical protein